MASHIEQQVKELKARIAELESFAKSIQHLDVEAKPITIAELTIAQIAEEAAKLCPPARTPKAPKKPPLHTYRIMGDIIREGIVEVIGRDLDDAIEQAEAGRCMVYDENSGNFSFSWNGDKQSIEVVDK